MSSLRKEEIKRLLRKVDAVEVQFVKHLYAKNVSEDTRDIREVLSRINELRNDLTLTWNMLRLEEEKIENEKKSDPDYSSVDGYKEGYEAGFIAGLMAGHNPRTTRTDYNTNINGWKGGQYDV